MVTRITDIDPESLRTGESDLVVGFATRNELQAVVSALLRSAAHEILYRNPRLDADHLGTADAIRGMERMLTENRSASLRTLVDSSQSLVASGHRLVETLRRFMPQVECRIRRPGLVDGPPAYLVVDQVAYLLLPDPDRHGGTAGFSAPGTAARLRDLFEQEWELGQPDPEMRPLAI